jgi:heme A synthase
MQISRRYRDLLVATSVLTCLLVALGGIVCITNSSRGCPDWPWCHGRLVPPLRVDSMLEYTHRVVAALTTVLIVASAFVGWRSYRTIRWVSRPPLMAIAFLLVVTVLGAMVVLTGLPPGLAALDLGSALAVLALMLVAAVVASSLHQDPSGPNRLSFRDSYARLSLAALAAVFVLFVSGVLVASDGSPVRCLSWPLYGGGMDPGARGWWQLARRVVGAGTAIMILALVVEAWRRPRRKGTVRHVASALGLLLLVEFAVGALVVLYGAAPLLQVAYVTIAALLWAALVVLVALAGLEPG